MASRPSQETMETSLLCEMDSSLENGLCSAPLGEDDTPSGSQIFEILVLIQQ